MARLSGTRPWRYFPLLGLVALFAEAQTLSLSVENDTFTGSDDSYSNGLILTYSSPEITSESIETFSSKWADTMQFLPGLTVASDARYVSYSIIHEIHTPEDLDARDPPLDDQPYSSILMLSNTVAAFTGQRSHYWNLRGGMVGQATGGKLIQREFHRLIDAKNPRGWDAQLPNEPLLNLGYMGGYTFESPKEFNAWQWRFSPAINVEVGNYLTAIGVGGLLELGINLPNGPLIPSLGQGLGSTMGIGTWDTSDWSLGFFIGGANYYVEHFVPLDGTMFRDSRSIAYDRSILMVTAGLQFRRKDISISFSATYNGPGVAISDDDMEYGTVTIAWRF